MRIAVPVAIVLLTAALAAAPAAPESLWSDLELRDLEGRTWGQKDLDGRVVLLDFWASWCAPCLAQFPVFQQAMDRFATAGFLVIGISMNETDRPTLERFLRTREVDWPQVHDGRGLAGPLARRLGVKAVPRTLLVDRQGRIVGVDLEGPALLAALPALLEVSMPDGDGLGSGPVEPARFDGSELGSGNDTYSPANASLDR